MWERTADLLIDTRCETGEGPVWDELLGHLWWTDIPARRIHRLDPASADHRVFDLPGRVGCFAFREAGGLVLAMEDGAFLYSPDTGVLTCLAAPEAGLPSHRFNDGRCDRRGRFLAGSMNLARDRPSAKLWQFRAQQDARPVVHDLTISNGLAFDAVGDRMYLVDGGRRQIFRFRYDEDGIPRDQTVFQDVGGAPGRPDGAAIDAEGCYWSARWAGGCVVRFTPDGRIDGIVRVPVGNVTMCAFGDTDLGTLFITTACEGMSAEEHAEQPHAGAVFAARTAVCGLVEPRFAG